ncbi:MAG: methyltransferase domain-containing protein [Actinobacteria bacterium]|jgi:SAM-dependent methyltransferase|nr:methyltransferase domain-containing protein [Actinomycetota bacterium]MBT3563725.1 methyltransferase domain-containing protein [Gammaproteobacteria bacterium]MBT3747138.1 methyltransferase domain-containing protein [Actinomycetota bacterium]MBT3969270.1 methyltransferase domain-containing protein [Actinomycetota bacterium]MBT4302986.1 methyltransferase domain-containing protein [Actinomycetota bacterium]
MTGTDSYRPELHGQGFEGALERLEAQAALMWPYERKILHQVAPTEVSTIVDLGCGTGSFLKRVAQDFPDAHLIGVDLDPGLLKPATDALPQAHFVESDAAHTGLEEGIADLVVLRFVLQHMADPSTVLREAFRLLRPGGRVLVFEVDGGLWGMCHPLIAQFEQLQAKIWTAQSQRNGNRMIGRELVGLLQKQDFSCAALRLYHYSSDDNGLDAFDPLLDPSQYLDLVGDGVLAPAELASATAAYRKWKQDPESWVMLVGFAASGIKQSDD